MPRRWLSLIGPVAALAASCASSPQPPIDAPTSKDGELHRSATTSASPATSAATASATSAPLVAGTSLDRAAFALVPETARRSSAARAPVRFEQLDYAKIPLSRPRDDASVRPIHVHVATGQRDGTDLALVTVDASIFAEVVVPNGHVFTHGHFSTPAKPLCAAGTSPLATAFGLLQKSWRRESVELAWYEGNLDGSACTVTLRERDHATAVALLPGLVYGARVADAKGAGEVLWLVTPPALFVSTAPAAPATTNAPLTAIALPVRPGATTSATFVVNAYVASDWLTWAGPNRDAMPLDTSASWSVSVDVSWVRGEPTPDASFSVSGAGAPSAKR